MFKNKLSFILISFVLVSTFLLLTPISATAEEAIEIGAIIPITGVSELEGRDMVRGIELAEEEINEAGGVLGRNLEVIVEDDETRPAAGIDAVHKLVDVDEVPVILGAYYSSVSIATGEYTNEEGVVQLSWSTSPELRNIGPYFFGVCGTDELMAANTVNFAVEDVGAERFGILVDNTDYGIGILRNSEAQIEEIGGEIVTEVRYEREKEDYRPELERLFSEDIDVVVGTAVGEDARTIFRQAYELGLEPEENWYLSWLGLATAPAVPETVEGFKGLVGRSEGPRADLFNERYEEKYGEEPPTVWGHYAYDAAWLAAIAMNFANSTEPDSIRDALHFVGDIYHGVSGGGDKSFDEDGMQKLEIYQRMIVRDGSLEVYE